MNKHEKEFIKFFIVASMGFYLFFSVNFGVITGVKKGKCEARSIQVYVNIPYRLACEFVRERW